MKKILMFLLAFFGYSLSIEVSEREFKSKGQRVLEEANFFAGIFSSDRYDLDCKMNFFKDKVDLANYPYIFGPYPIMDVNYANSADKNRSLFLQWKDKALKSGAYKAASRFSYAVVPVTDVFESYRCQKEYARQKTIQEQRLQQLKDGYRIDPTNYRNLIAPSYAWVMKNFITGLPNRAINLFKRVR